MTFTGSADTGKMLKSHPKIVEKAVPFNMEADSLNCSVMGEDAVPGTAEFDLFIKEVQKEMTVKAGQKCTAVRRIIVPEKLMEDVETVLETNNPITYTDKLGAVQSTIQTTILSIDTDEGVLEPLGIGEIITTVQY